MLTKIILLLLLFYYISFHENYFYFCMFRDVPACSVFRVLSTAFLQGVQTSYRLTNSLSKSSKKWLLAN